MEIALAVATILGGLAALWFFADKLFKSAAPRTRPFGRDGRRLAGAESHQEPSHTEDPPGASQIRIASLADVGKYDDKVREVILKAAREELTKDQGVTVDLVLPAPRRPRAQLKQMLLAARARISTLDREAILTRIRQQGNVDMVGSDGAEAVSQAIEATLSDPNPETVAFLIRIPAKTVVDVMQAADLG